MKEEQPMSGSYHLLQYGITEPLVCSACEAEFAAGSTDAASLRNYMRLDVGFTAYGVQVWCQRHERNVCHVDFDGMIHEADLRCLLPAAG